MGIQDLFWNQRDTALVNFNFMLRVELAFDLPCKSVRAFTRELEYDYIQEGGLNDYVHMLRKPISKPFTLEVERYVGVDYVDPLPLGANLALPLLLFVGRNPNQFIPGLVARTYTFTGCTVMKKVYGELVGDQSGLLVETTTIGYREMLVVDIPWSHKKTDVGVDYATPAGNSVWKEAQAKQKELEKQREAEKKAQEETAKRTKEASEARKKQAEEAAKAQKKADEERTRQDEKENAAALAERRTKAEQAQKAGEETEAATEESQTETGDAKEEQNLEE